MSLVANAVSSRNVRVAILVLLMLAAVFAGASSPHTWTSPSPFGNWGDTISWTPFDNPPFGPAITDGDSLIFPDATGSGGTVYSFNNLGNTATPIYYRPGPIQITSTSVAYQFSGNDIEINSSISSASSPLNHSWYIPVHLFGNASIDFRGGFNGNIDLAGNTLALAASSGSFSVYGDISGSGTVNVGPTNTSSEASIYYEGSKTYTGPTNVQNGSLYFDYSSGVPGDVNLLSGGMLSLYGSIGGNVVIASGGRIAEAGGPASIGGSLNVQPGGVLDAGVGRITVATSGGTFTMAGTQYFRLFNNLAAESQPRNAAVGQRKQAANGFFFAAANTITVAPGGSVVLSGNLIVALSTSVSPGQTYTVIDNQDPSSPISGTYNGLPEGAIVTDTNSAQQFRISYVGGDGNDVTLLALRTPTITAVAPANGPTSGGTSVTITGSFDDPMAFPVPPNNPVTVTVNGTPALVTFYDGTTVTFDTPPGPSGPATIRVTNGDGGFAETTAFSYDAPIITSITPPSATAGSTVTINGQNLNFLNSVKFGGVSAAYTSISPTQVQATVPALPPGPAPVVVTSGSTSSNAASFFVACPTFTPVVTASGPTTFCTGGSVTLTAPSGYSFYSWSNGANTQSITVSTSGSYSVLVVDSNSCSGSSAPTTVTVNPNPTATITPSGPTTFCSGGSVTLTAPAGATSYLWSPGGQTAQSINVTTSGNYTVTVTNSSGCSATSAPTSVTVNPTPAATITPSGPTTFCSGGSVTLTAPSGASSYLWSPGGQTTQSINVTASGNYTVTATNSNGCSATSAPTTVTVNPAATATITPSGPTTFCAGGSVTLTAPSGASSYLWSPGGQTTQSINVTTSGNYSVTVTNGSCSATSAPTTVTVNPSPTVSITGPTSSCSGGNVTLTASGTNISSYLWSPGGQTTPSITVPVSGGSTSTYTVTVSSSSGCTASATHTITPSSPRTIPIEVPSSVVAGSTATAFAVGSFSNYTWSVLNGEIVSGQGTNTLTFRAGSSGNVTLFVTAPDGICSADGSANVPITSCASSGPTLVGPSSGATVTAPVTFSWNPVAGGVSYEVWTSQGTAAPTMIGSTSGSSFSAALPSGTFNWFVVARLGAGCPNGAVQSETRSFTVAPGTNCPTAAPVPQSPSMNAHAFSPVTFRWTLASGASGYRVYVKSGTGGFEDLGLVSGSTTSLVATLPPGDAAWYVEAVYSGCPSVASAPILFTLDREDCSTHTSATLLAPPNNSNNAGSATNFRWASVEGADGYRVWVSINNSEFQTIGETAETSFRATLEPGNIRWYVETLFEGCASTESSRQAFAVPTLSNCNNQAPQLLAPADNSTTSSATTTFSWSNVGALEYELYLSVASGTPALLTKTTNTSFTTEVPVGELDFFVRALFNGCPARTSASRHFTYQPPAACGTDRPIAISPQSDTFPIPSPVKFRWSSVPGATQYRLTIAASDGIQVINTTQTEVTQSVASGAASWTVEAMFGNSCPTTTSAPSEFFVVATPNGCVALTQPLIAAPSQISDNVTYTVQWQPVVGATSYQLQRSATGDFSSVTPINVNDIQATFTDRNQGTAPITFFYRVRALSNRCTPTANGPYSAVAPVVILPAVQNASTSEGSTPAAQPQLITYSIQLGPEVAGQSFTATPTAPWITVTPSSGTVPTGGISLTVKADTTGLPVGTSAGNVLLSLTTPSLTTGPRQAANATSVTPVPVTVNKVTPVTPNPKSAPPPDALIIPAVAHADGVNSKFESDVRVTNTSAQVVKYQLTFTPTGDAGIADGRQATVDIEPGRTMALDDILKSWFATGQSSAIGTLEIRALTKTASSTSSNAVKGLQNFPTFASSRTFNNTAGGTFGQYIPAIPFANFVGRSNDAAKPAVLSLQQIAQSPQYRTNLGLIEGSGQPAELLVTVFGKSGNKLTDFTVNLSGGQHLQMGSVLQQKGVSVDDGRVEVKVMSPGGKVTAYASVLDNKTNDSLLVTPVNITDTGSNKFVLPGVAELSAGIPWQTDMRLFNPGTEPINATLTFQPLNATTSQTANVSVAPGEVRQLDRVLSTLFNVTNDGGAIHIATPNAVNLIATARTYRPDASGGSFGQFIQAVTPDQAVALNTRPLQILQVEESPQFRSNIGIAEVTGQAATVEVTVIPPDSKANATIRVPMAANQFRQLNSLLQQMGLPDTHNARVTVRVVQGTGRVTAYASVIDAKTADPTFVPAQ